MTSFIQRVIGAAKLDVHIYEEVEADTTAMPQAMGVVALSSAAAGIGAIGQESNLGLFGGLLAALLGWALWAGLTYFIGTRILPTSQTHADWGELLRTTGFAAAPGVLRILGIVPGLTGIVFFAAVVWMLAAFVVAVRQALDYTSTGRAVGVCLIGWLVNGVIVGFASLLVR
jgi:hypothetical protein